MCKPYFLRYKSGTSDIKNSTRDTYFPNLPDAGGGEEINPTTPNSPGDNIALDNGAYKEDATLILNKLRIKNSERIIIGHLNINHIEKKFEPLVSLVNDKLGVFLLSETKIDISFLSTQFTIEGYSNPFRRERNIHGGGLLLYIRDDIPCKQIKSYALPGDIECFFVEIKLRNNKYILVGEGLHLLFLESYW